MPKKTLEEQRQYLRSMLELSDREETLKALQIRRQYLEPTESDEPKDLTTALASMRTSHLLYEDCRKNFWRVYEDDIGPILNSNRMDDNPMLSDAIRRLRSWHRLRDTLVAMKEDIGRFSLAGEIVRLAQLEAREAAELRIGVLNAMNRGEYRRFRSDAVQIKQDYPEVYALEAKWLEDIIQFRRSRRRVPKPEAEKTPETVAKANSNRTLLIVAVVVVGGIVRLFYAILNR